MEEKRFVRNRLGGDTYAKTISATFNEFIKALSEHCGPFASNAVIPCNLKGEVADVYSKDGITIADSMRYKDSVAKYVARILSHVGRRVDSACHDGTTTSMLTFAHLGKNIMTDHHTIDQSEDLSRVKYLREFTNCLNECREVIKKNTISLDDLHQTLQEEYPDRTITHDDIVRLVAYQQALIASKGDVDMSKGISEVLSSMPVELYEQFTVKSAMVETDYRFKLIKYDYDFKLRTNSPRYDECNAGMGSKIFLPHVDILMIRDALTPGNEVFNTLLAAIDPDCPPEKQIEYHVKPASEVLKRPLFILCRSLDGVQLQDAINKHNRRFPELHIYYAPIHIDDKLRAPTDEVFHAISNTPVATPMQVVKNLWACLAKDCAIDYFGHILKISNVYRKTDRALHPFFGNKKRYPLYAKVYADLKERIDANTKNINAEDTVGDHILNGYITLYRFLTCQHLMDLESGGLTYEQTYNKAAVTDAMGAATSAVAHGFVMGGYGKLYAYFEAKLSLCEKTKGQGRRSASEKTLAIRAFRDTFRDILATIYFARTNGTPASSVEEESLQSSLGTETSKYDYTLPYMDRSRECTTLLLRTLITHPKSKAKARRPWRVDFADPTETLLVQPAMGYTEQFRRFEDTLPKLFNSSCLIDTTYLSQEDTGE